MERFPEEPKGFGIWYGLAHVQGQNSDEAEPVIDLILQPVIAEAIEFL